MKNIIDNEINMVFGALSPSATSTAKCVCNYHRPNRYGYAGERTLYMSGDPIPPETRYSELTRVNYDANAFYKATCANYKAYITDTDKLPYDCQVYITESKDIVERV